jgi:hypothetical protein
VDHQSCCSIPDHSNRKAIKANPRAASPFKILSGNSTATEPPARTPIALAKIKAVTDPKNTARGWLELPLIAMPADSCPQSPPARFHIVLNLSELLIKHLQK